MVRKEALPHIDPTSWDERLKFGGFFINGEATYTDIELPLPCRIEYYEPKFELTHANEFFSSFKREYIIFEDEYLLAVFKTNKLPAMAGREQTHFNLKKSLDEYNGSPIHMPSRLDTSTSGIVLVSKSIRSHDKLQRKFQNRHISKSYLLITDRAVSWYENCLVAPIGKNPLHPILRKVDFESGRTATTRFFRIHSESGLTLLLAQPITGRTHQIRVHSHHLAMPIIGDCFYDGTPASSLHLLSYSLSLKHPILGTALNLKVPNTLLPSWINDNNLLKLSSFLG